MITAVAAWPISLLSLVIGEHRDNTGNIMVVRLCTPHQIRFNRVTSRIYSPLVESQPSCFLINQEKSNTLTWNFLITYIKLLLNSIKVWLAISFFPIEHHDVFTRLRELLSPFMKNIQKCYTNQYIDGRERGIICDEIINSASSIVNPTLLSRLNRLINQQQNELSLEHQRQRQLNIGYKNALEMLN